ncbi:MAG TPA: MotA/TolQ/ExbB proton channel family protein [Burkholderiales bacterium]|nr:MotA/TolQ/ExbB proton channel family protein [Burkholderiales bacterium]
MFAIIEAAGWPIWLLVIASIIALAIIVERLWSLRQGLVAPKRLLEQVITECHKNGITPQLVARLSAHSPLGQIFAAGLKNLGSPPEVLKDAIEDVGRSAARELGRFLTTLGTIATISPLLGLFGTVVGMIEIFGSQGPTGSNPIMLAHGISVALYNTAFGIIVAVPSMIFYRHFRGKAEALLIEMEMQAAKLVEILQGERQD